MAAAAAAAVVVVRPPNITERVPRKEKKASRFRSDVWETFQLQLLLLLLAIFKNSFVWCWLYY